MDQPLILKRASASRSSGEWSDDDYDVCADGVVVGRILKVHAAPVGSSWMWTLVFGYHEDRTPTRGDARRRDSSVRQQLAPGVWRRNNIVLALSAVKLPGMHWSA